MPWLRNSPREAGLAEEAPADYSMTKTAEYLAQALKEIELVKTQEALMGWHDLYFTSFEYLRLTEEEAQQLELAYQDRDEWLWLWGVGA